MSKVVNPEIQKFFNDFSKHYNQEAFYASTGLSYLDQIETGFIINSTKRLRINRLLEIGFGAGRNLSLFRNKKIKMDGVDISEKMIKETRHSLSDEDVDLKHIDAQNGLPYKDNSFDLIMCIRVLKYMKKWPYVVSEISRCLRTGGYTILEVPNLLSIHLLGLFWANYFLFFVPEFLKVLKENNLEVVKVKKGAILPFFVYKYSNNEYLVKFISWIDSSLNKLLPIGLISRNYVFMLRKY